MGAEAAKAIPYKRKLRIITEKEGEKTVTKAFIGETELLPGDWISVVSGEFLLCVLRTAWKPSLTQLAQTI